MGDTGIFSEPTKPPSRSYSYTLPNSLPGRLPSVDLIDLSVDLFGNPPVRTISRERPRLRIRLKQNKRTENFRDRFFSSITDEQWTDWKWQLSHQFTSLKTLSNFIQLSPEESCAEAEGVSLPVGVTPYYASLFHDQDSCHPLRKAMVPQVFETLMSTGEAVDPLDEGKQSPVPGLVHRYPDRVLFLVTNTCSCYCRYCTRSRLVGHDGHLSLNIDTWRQAIEYIRAHQEIRDVLVSGGDPLILPDEALRWILERLRAIPHVEIIRIGTKMPAVLPQRITPALVRMLKRFHPLWISIHFTHPDELTPESTEACGRLADAGIPLGSQTVLLAGVNDDVNTMRRLCQGLLRMRVRPYYLYQCDPIPGSSHFRTPVSKGIEIIRGLRGHTTGYAIPTYVIDAPGGGGKIPLSPDYLVSNENGQIELQNYAGKHYVYPDTLSEGDPQGSNCSC